MPTRLHNSGIITSCIDKAVTNSNEGTFFHPVLSDTEHVEGFKLGIDFWACTLCAGKHAFIEEFNEGKTVTGTGFTSSIGSLSNLLIVNFICAYDAPDETVLLLECNNLIYLDQKMSDSLLNPIQAEKVSVRVGTQTKWYYHNDVRCQSLHFPDGTIITGLYEGVIPYISIFRPTK